jgi:hypothetical protein
MRWHTSSALSPSSAGIADDIFRLIPPNERAAFREMLEHDLRDRELPDGERRIAERTWRAFLQYEPGGDKHSRILDRWAALGEAPSRNASAIRSSFILCFAAQCPQHADALQARGRQRCRLKATIFVSPRSRERDTELLGAEAAFTISRSSVSDEKFARYVRQRFDSWPPNRLQPINTEKTNGESTPPAITSFSSTRSGKSSPRKCWPMGSPFTIVPSVLQRSRT